MQWWGRCVSQQGALNISSAIDLAARRHVPESPRITPPQHTRQRRSEMRMSAVSACPAERSDVLTKASSDGCDRLSWMCRRLKPDMTMA